MASEKAPDIVQRSIRYEEGVGLLGSSRHPSSFDEKGQPETVVTSPSEIEQIAKPIPRPMRYSKWRPKSWDDAVRDRIWARLAYGGGGFILLTIWIIVVYVVNYMDSVA